MAVPHRPRGRQHVRPVEKRKPHTGGRRESTATSMRSASCCPSFRSFSPSSDSESHTCRSIRPTNRTGNPHGSSNNPAPSFFRFPFHNLLPAAFLRQIHGSADRYRQVRYAFRYRRVRKTCVGIARYRRSMSLWKRSRMCWAVSGWSIRSLMMGMIVLSSGRYRRRVRQRRRGGS